MFGASVAVLEVDVATLLRAQRRPHLGTGLSVLPR